MYAALERFGFAGGRVLEPEADLRHSPFEEARLQPESFDLAVSVAARSRSAVMSVSSEDRDSPRRKVWTG